MNWQDYMNLELKNSKKQRLLMTKITLNPTHPNRNKWIAQLKKITSEDEIEFILYMVGVK